MPADRGGGRWLAGKGNGRLYLNHMVTQLSL